MREIKFRGLRIDDGKMIQGNLLRINDYHYIRPHDYGDLNDLDFGRSFDEVYGHTVGQVTGLHDKHGKDIYEGDICKNHNGCIGFIVYDTIHARVGFSIKLQCTDNKKRKIPYSIASTSVLEVIGNIHESTGVLEAADGK